MSIINPTTEDEDNVRADIKEGIRSIWAELNAKQLLDAIISSTRAKGEFSTLQLEVRKEKLARELPD